MDTVPMLDVMNAIEICFFSKLEEKTNWGRKQVKELFKQSLLDAADAGDWLPEVTLEAEPSDDSVIG